MPEYLYTDELGHLSTVTHEMFYNGDVICDQCGAEMWRKPQPINVTWGGLAPSKGEVNPEVQHLLDTADERRAKFDAEHEEHERRTKGE